MLIIYIYMIPQGENQIYMIPQGGKQKKHNIRPDDINLKHPNTSFIESLNHVYRRAQEREGKDEKTLT